MARVADLLQHGLTFLISVLVEGVEILAHGAGEEEGFLGEEGLLL